VTPSDLFDARQILLCEQSPQPDPRWSTVSLVTAVRGLVSWTPAGTLAWPRESSPDSRLTAFRAAAGELTRRGVDADSLVRYGMRNEIAASLMCFLLIKALGLEIPELVEQRGVDIDSWNAAMPSIKGIVHHDISLESIEQAVNRSVKFQIPVILPWIMRAPLTSLVTLSPPELVSFSEPAPILSDSNLYQQYAWLVDRFSTTSFDDWLTSSLHLEYRWHAEQEPPPCPVGLMSDRDLNLDSVNAEIAQRAVLNVPAGEPNPESALAAEMASHARALLTQGRSQEAIALFEFASIRRPSDAQARNNLGFCRIPENPKRALLDLEAAANMGYHDMAVNIYNRICCLMEMRQTRPAIALANSYWEKKTDSSNAAILWRPANGTWQIEQVDDPHQALAELMISASWAAGLPDEEAIWRERLGPQSTS
jgi:hypothetical protein